MYGQCSHFITPKTPENLWFSGAFKMYKMGLFGTKGLTTID